MAWKVGVGGGWHGVLRSGAGFDGGGEVAGESRPVSDGQSTDSVIEAALNVRIATVSAKCLRTPHMRQT
jgi:hypothetical protein